MKLTSTKSQELTYIRALLVGDSGIGKTTSLRTLPPERTLLITGERGALPLRDMDFRAIQVENWDDCKAAYLVIANPPANAEDAFAKAVEGVACIVIDSLSEVSAMCIRHIVQVDRKALIKQRTKGKSDTPDNVYEDMMQMEDWGLYRDRIKSLVSAFCHLPKHVIFTVLAGWSEDRRTGATYLAPGLNGKVAREVPAYFDLVFHMQSRDVKTDNGTKNERVWQTFNDGRVIAKDSSGVLEPYEEPDWGKVFGKIITKEVGK